MTPFGHAAETPTETLLRMTTADQLNHHEPVSIVLHHHQTHMPQVCEHTAVPLAVMFCSSMPTCLYQPAKSQVIHSNLQSHHVCAICML